MLLQEPALAPAAHVEEPAHRLRIGLRFHADRQHDHIDRNPANDTRKGVLGPDDKLTFLLRRERPVRHLGNPATNELDAVLERLVIELFAALAWSADVEIEDRHIGSRMLADQLCELH